MNLYVYSFTIPFASRYDKVREENDDNDHGVLVEAFTEQVGFKNTYLPLVQNNIHDSLVMLMEQDIPMNYEEAMVYLSTRNDYES